MIKHVLTFVSGLQQESVLVDFIRQNKVKILYKVKTGQNSLHQKFPKPKPYKNEKSVDFFVFFLIFELLLKFYAQFYLIIPK